MSTNDPAWEEREILSWADVGPATRELAQKVHDDGFKPDLILAIARGGLIVAASLGYALGVKNTFTLNVEFYTGIDRRLPMPLILPIPSEPVLHNMHDAKVLVCDDVADTGGTLEVVGDFCRGKVADVRFATLYQKPRSTVQCEYSWKVTDRWIEFPWSLLPVIGQ